jgi:hypothetical protein
MRAFFVPLMDICKLDTPVLKRIPNSQRANFATTWGRLLDEATDKQQEADWSEFFLFPKCILWSPVRGGKRLAKKANMAEIVRSRLVQWAAGGKEKLWKDAVERSKRPEGHEERKQGDQNIEKRVLEALRLGDVRKSLQALNSAPIATKTQATLERLRRLHPEGADPSPLPNHEAPRFTEPGQPTP